MADKKEGDAPSTGTLAAATERIRESAKWLLAAFAAVGVTFAAGLQLADLGELGADDGWRLVAALVGIVVVVVSIVVAIRQTAAVASASRVNLSLIAGNDDFAAVRDEINQDTDLLYPYDDVGKFREAFQQARTDETTAYDAAVTASQAARTASDADRDRLVAEAQQAKAAYDVVAERLRQRDDTRQEMLQLASYLRVKNAFEEARTIVAVMAATAALGLVAFAWGANPPASQDLDPGEVLPKTPSEVTLVLRDRADLRSQLGADCDLTAVPAIAISVEGETYRVATEQTDTCDAAWLEIGPRQGEVVPRVSPDLGGSE